MVTAPPAPPTAAELLYPDSAAATATAETAVYRNPNQPVRLPAPPPRSGINLVGLEGEYSNIGRCLIPLCDFVTEIDINDDDPGHAFSVWHEADNAVRYHQYFEHPVADPRPVPGTPVAA